MRKLIFKKIVSAHKNIVYNQAFYFTGNKEDAEDITQDVLIKLWHHIDDVKNSSAKSWLLTVTRNLCIDYSRKKRALTFSEIHESGENPGFEGDLIDANTDLENRTIKADMMKQVMNTLNQLPERIRSIVIMRDIQDFTYEMIAEIMGLPLNTVKVYLHRGRKYLAKHVVQN